MEPVSLAVGLLPLIKLTTSVYYFIKDYKDASRQYQDLAEEIGELHTVLNALDHLQVAAKGSGSSKVPPPDPAAPKLQNLLARLRKLLEWLETELRRDRNDFVRQLKYHFKKPEFKELRENISETKTSITLFLTTSNTASFLEKHRQVSSKLDVLIYYQKEDQKTKLLSWLTPVNFLLRQQDIVAKRHPGTGEWFLDAETYRSWRDGSAYDVLFCPGIPGAGKTIIAAMVADDLLAHYQESPGVMVACLYCNHSETNEQSAESFLANIIKQALQRHPLHPPPLKLVELLEDSAKSRPSFTDLDNVFKDLFRYYDVFFIILDALDEAVEDASIHTRLLTLLRTQSNVKLLVTSRGIGYIEQTFKKTPRIEIQADGLDVQKYAIGRIRNTPSINRFVKTDPESDLSEKKITDKIVQRTQGMFLLAKFQIDALENKTRARDLRRAIDTLPRDFEASYNEIWIRIQDQPPDKARLAKKVLIWVSMAMRPLTMKELQHALAVESDSTEIDEDDIHPEEMILSVCAGLVTVEEHTGNLQLVHFTASEWLEASRASLFPDYQNELASTCIHYLSLHYDHETRSDFQFLDYALSHWADHTRGDAEVQYMDDIIRTLKKPDQLQVALRNARFIHPEDEESLHDGTSRLQLAAALGLAHVVDRILQDGVSVNATRIGPSTALMHAMTMGQKITTLTLLGKNEVNVRTYKNTDPLLLIAARADWGDVIEILIQKGADVSLEGEGAMALHTALERRCVAASKALLAGMNIANTPRLTQDHRISPGSSTKSAYEQLLFCSTHWRNPEQLRDFMISIGADQSIIRKHQARIVFMTLDDEYESVEWPHWGWDDDQLTSIYEPYRMVTRSEANRHDNYAEISIAEMS